MKRRFRLPVPLAVLAAACATGCLRTCSTDPVPPEYFTGVHEDATAGRLDDLPRRLASDPCVDPRVDLLPDASIGWRGDPDLVLLRGALLRAWRIRPEDYPDADEISLLEWEETGYWTNGVYATQWTTVSKILTQRGLENNRTFSFSNNDFYGSTTVLVARVHSPDGTARDVDLAANLAEAVDTGSLASNIHDPNDKTFTLALPGLQVGDAVELSILRRAKRPRCEGVYADYLTFESDHPILFQGVRITGPASMPLRSRAFRDAGPVKLDHAAHTNETFGTITEAWTAGETPRYFAEPDMPPAYDCTARLLLSTAPDWESLSRWYARLCAPHLAATNAAMADKVASILRDVVAQDRAESRTELIHRMYSVRPEAAEKILPDGSDWKEFLAARGVAWPEGSSIRFLPSLGKFVVKNTVENLGKIERLFGQFDLFPFNPAWATTPGSYQITSRSAMPGSADESHAESAENAELPSRDAPTSRPSDWEMYGIRPSAEKAPTGETFGRMFVPAIPSPAGENAMPDDWKAYFSTLGVRWPEGSSVELAADGSGILARNTFPELEALASRHGTFDSRRLPAVFVDAQGLAPLQLRADGSTVVRPADRVVPPGAAQRSRIRSPGLVPRRAALDMAEGSWI